MCSIVLCYILDVKGSANQAVVRRTIFVLHALLHLLPLVCFYAWVVLTAV